MLFLHKCSSTWMNMTDGCLIAWGGQHLLTLSTELSSVGWTENQTLLPWVMGEQNYFLSLFLTLLFIFFHCKGSALLSTDDLFVRLNWNSDKCN